MRLKEKEARHFKSPRGSSMTARSRTVTSTPAADLRRRTIGEGAPRDLLHCYRPGPSTSVGMSFEPTDA